MHRTRGFFLLRSYVCKVLRLHSVKFFFMEHGCADNRPLDTNFLYKYRRNYEYNGSNYVTDQFWQLLDSSEVAYIGNVARSGRAKGIQILPFLAIHQFRQFLSCLKVANFGSCTYTPDTMM